MVRIVSGKLKIQNGTGILMRKFSVQSSHLASSIRERPSEDLHYRTIHHKILNEDMRVLLFDDILTTGNTVRACVRRILDAGPTPINVFTLSKTRCSQ
ncbi:phosphoribosyltransferase [Methanothermobacter sp.]|uniref:phosphoribosyltransferase n=1 Tax=Methanothermobacter sp. TaxID=1884223 RepID=UPI0026337B6F|nr:phosphoribosyltransferase [Methanothermobacter sp.]MDI9617685.1 phosphoribosyltransferase [Methanothermobacter sp.]